MKKKYLLENKEFWMQVITISELDIPPIYSKQVSASQLKKIVSTTEQDTISITSTLPNVYVCINDKLYCIAYRPFLCFISDLCQVEDQLELNWLTHGF